MKLPRRILATAFFGIAFGLAFAIIAFAGSTPCWCCITDPVSHQKHIVQANPNQCSHCYPTAAAADIGCFPQPCWCCVRKGGKIKVVKVGEGKCHEMGGFCYATYKEAKACKGDFAGRESH